MAAWFSWVLKAMSLGELSYNYTTAVYCMSTATMEEEIVDVNMRLNQAVRQQFSRTSSGIALNFQRPG